MNLKSFLALCLMLAAHCCWSDVKAQTMPRHTVSIGLGGAGSGLGPVYEGLVVAKPRIRIGLTAAWPLVHERWFWFTPYTLRTWSAGFTMRFGKRALQPAMAVEFNSFLAKGYPDFPPYDVISLRRNTVVLMGGLRYRAQGSHISVGAEAGLGLRQVPRHQYFIPVGLVHVGYTFGNVGERRQREPLPPTPPSKQALQTQRQTAFLRTFKLQLAPYAGASLYKLFTPLDMHTYRGQPITYNDYMPPRWNAQLGLQGDLARPGNLLGLRLGLGAGLRSTRYDWSAIQAASDSLPLSGSVAHIQSLDLVLHLRACLRLRSHGERPWVVQAGWETGLVLPIVAHSWLHVIPSFWEELPAPRLGYLGAPILVIGKQFPVGKWTLEPSLQGTCSFNGLQRFPGICKWSAGVGLAIWGNR